MDTTSTTGPASILSTVSTMDTVSILNMEVFTGVPLWLVLGSVIVALIVLALLMALISLVSHSESAVENKVHPAPVHYAPAHQEPSPHATVVELQKVILKNMDDTSKQNRLMIWLTIITILISVLGGSVIMNYFQNLGNFSSTWIAQFLDYVKNLLAR